MASRFMASDLDLCVVILVAKIYGVIALLNKRA